MIDIYMDYYDFETEVKIVQAHSHIPLTQARKIVEIVRTIREELPDAHKPGTRAEIMISQGLKVLGTYSKGDFEQICLDVLATKIGNPKEPLNKTRFIKEILKDSYEASTAGKIATAIQDIAICEN
jgi:hypothetical protein